MFPLIRVRDKTFVSYEPRSEMIPILILCITGVAIATDCPDGWLAYKGSCYLFGNDNVHFTEAEEYCRHHGSHLVHVETREEDMFLKGFINGHLKVDTDYWLGMTDEITEGLWKWYGKDTPVEYFDWSPSEPQDAFGGEDCAMFGHLLHFRWADVSCVTKRTALCEKRFLPLLVGSFYKRESVREVAENNQTCA